MAYIPGDYAGLLEELRRRREELERLRKAAQTPIRTVALTAPPAPKFDPKAVAELADRFPGRTPEELAYFSVHGVFPSAVAAAKPKKGHWEEYYVEKPRPYMAGASKAADWKEVLKKNLLWLYPKENAVPKTPDGKVDKTKAFVHVKALGRSMTLEEAERWAKKAAEAHNKRRVIRVKKQRWVKPTGEAVSPIAKPTGGKWDTKSEEDIVRSALVLRSPVNRFVYRVGHEPERIFGKGWSLSRLRPGTVQWRAWLDSLDPERTTVMNRLTGKPMKLGELRDWAAQIRARNIPKKEAAPAVPSGEPTAIQQAAGGVVPPESIALAFPLPHPNETAKAYQTRVNAYQTMLEKLLEMQKLTRQEALRMRRELARVAAAGEANKELQRIKNAAAEKVTNIIQKHADDRAAKAARARIEAARIAAEASMSKAAAGTEASRLDRWRKEADKIRQEYQRYLREWSLGELPEASIVNPGDESTTPRDVWKALEASVRNALESHRPVAPIVTWFTQKYPGPLEEIAKRFDEFVPGRTWEDWLAERIQEAEKRRLSLQDFAESLYRDTYPAADWAAVRRYLLEGAQPQEPPAQSEPVRTPPPDEEPPAEETAPPRLDEVPEIPVAPWDVTEEEAAAWLFGGNA